MSDPEGVPYQALYIGRRYMGRKLRYLFYDLTKGDDSPKEYIESQAYIYDVKPKSPVQNLRLLNPGAMYRLIRVGDKTRFPEQSPTGVWGNMEDRAYWDTVDWAAYQESNGNKALRKELDDALRQHLRPVIEAYRSTNGVNRAHILARVVQIITT